jgi:hypothetical protein
VAHRAGDSADLEQSDLTFVHGGEGVGDEGVETRLVDLDVEDGAAAGRHRCRLHAVEGVRRAAFGSTPGFGSTTIAPYMPFAMCIRTGFVPQWYMNTPGSFARKL